MFEKIAGLPAHALIVHAAVVFGPLLVLAALVYAFVPRLRGRLGWVLAALAVVAPVTLWVARLSGEALRRLMVEKNYPAEILGRVDTHSGFGRWAAWAATALGVLSLLLVLVHTAVGRRQGDGGSKAVMYALVVLTVIAAGITGYYVIRTGDTGARSVWGSF